MPIEFRCSQCGKMLRTGDDTAGRQAQCPECGAVSVIPSVSPIESPFQPSAPIGGGNPFSVGPTFGVQDSGNPYQSPISPTFAMPGQADPFYAEQRLAGPAIALTVTAILSLVMFTGIAVLYLVVGFAEHKGGMGGPQNQEGLVMGIVMMEGMAFCGMFISLLIAIGARKMRNRESYAWAMTAAILALIPCVSPCLPLGLPFGIWALVVLCDSSVRAAFRN